MTRTLASARLFAVAGALLVAPACVSSTDDIDAVDEADLEAEPALLVAAQPLAAPQAVHGLTRASAASGHSSQWWRSPTAECPSATQLVGLGMRFSPNSSVLFRGLIPRGSTNSPDANESAAQEDQYGTDAEWNLISYAMCAAPLTSQYTAAATSPSSSSVRKVATVTCQPGTQVVGAGGTIAGADQKVKIDLIRPSADLSSVTVHASEHQYGTDYNWAVRAYAVCAVPPSGLVRTSAVAYNDWEGSVIARCPAGKRLLSAAGGVDAEDTSRLRVFETYPSPDFTFARVSVGTNGPTSGVTGSVHAYAICAN